MYGSGANGLAIKGSSDIDICVKIPEESEEIIYNNNLLYEVIISGIDCFYSDEFKLQKSSVFNATFGSNVDITLESKS